MNVINYAIKKMKNTMLGKPKFKNSSILLGQATCISSLTGVSNKKSDASQTNHEQQASNALLRLKSFDDNANSCSVSTKDTSSTASSTNVSMSDFFCQKKDVVIAIVAGRPKGSTDSVARSLGVRIEAVTSEAAYELAKLHNNNSSKKRLSKGSLKDIILMAKAKHGVDENIVILAQTLRKGVKRGSKSGHVGQTSPMAVI